MARSGNHSITTDRQFFALLSAGIWNQVPDHSLFRQDVDWEELYRLSYAQTLTGHVVDGINRLSPDCLPAQEERLDPFLSDSIGTQRRNRQLDLFIPFLFKALQGIPILLIKGQALALEYPDPERRQPGDIDLLLQPKDYFAAKEILVPKATKVGEESLEVYSLALHYKSIEVELHGSIRTLMSPVLDGKLAALQEELFQTEDFRYVQIGGADIPVPNPGFNAIYILVHFLHHYWSGGVGLRQLTDWMVYVSSNKREIDPILLEQRLEYLGLKRIWQTFAGFVCAYMGCPEEKMPLWTDRYASKYPRIWAWIKKSGNFGKNQPRIRKAEPYFVRKIHSFLVLVVQDRLRHFLTFPTESLRYFAGAFGYGIKRLLKGV